MVFETEHGKFLPQRQCFFDPLLDVIGGEFLDFSEEENLGDQFLSSGVFRFSADVPNYYLIFPPSEVVPLSVLME